MILNFRSVNATSTLNSKCCEFKMNLMTAPTGTWFFPVNPMTATTGTYFSASNPIFLDPVTCGSIRGVCIHISISNRIASSGDDIVRGGVNAGRIHPNV